MQFAVSQFRKSLLHDERGNVTVFIAIAMFAMVLAMGAAIDMSRAQTLQTRLQTATDAAGLGAGSTAKNMPATAPSWCTSTTWTKSDWLNCQAYKYFNANYSQQYLESATITDGSSASLTAAANSFSTNYNDSGNIFNVTANTTQNTQFMNLSQSGGTGTPKVYLGASTQIVPTSTQGVELAIVIDNSGSMSNPPPGGGATASSKMGSAVLAISGPGGLFSIIGTNPQDATKFPSNIFVSLVPFASDVQLNSTQAASVFVMPGGSGTCPDARNYYTSSGIAADNGGTTYLNKTGGTQLTLDNSEDAPAAPVPICPPLGRPGPCRPTYGTTDFLRMACAPTADENGLSASPPVAIVPLTNTVSDITNQLNAMTASGNTLLNIGMAWGWRTISPYWDSSSHGWTGLPAYNGYALPLSYAISPYGPTGAAPPPRMEKIVIFMSDGMNYPLYDSSFDVLNAYTADYRDSTTDWQDDFWWELCNDDGTYNYGFYSIPNKTGAYAGSLGAVGYDYYGFTYSTGNWVETDISCNRSCYYDVYDTVNGSSPPLTYSPYSSKYSEHGPTYMNDDDSLYQQNYNYYYGVTVTYPANQNTATPIPPDYCYREPQGVNAYYSPPLNRTYAYSPLELDQDFIAECTAMKAQGITIYTIGFGVPDPSSPNPIPYDDRWQNNYYYDGPTLQACASPGDFYAAPSEAALKQAFQSIGAQLTSLRVSQ